MVVFKCVVAAHVITICGRVLLKREGGNDSQGCQTYNKDCSSPRLWVLLEQVSQFSSLCVATQVGLKSYVHTSELGLFVEQQDLNTEQINDWTCQMFFPSYSKTWLKSLYSDPKKESMLNFSY